MKIKKCFRLLKHKFFIYGFLILLQFLIIYLVLFYISKYYYLFFEILAAILAVYIFNKKINPEYKLAWIAIILLFPIFGGVVYLIFDRRNNANTKKNKKIKAILDEAKVKLKRENIFIQDDFATNMFNYVQNVSYYQAHKCSEIIYLESGEIFFDILLKELIKAKNFIFMEYFIIEEGKMWNSILNILEKKVAEGVDVRLIYDDIGTLFTLDSKYSSYLEKKGIKTLVFNELKPTINVIMNNRSHRKLTVIDGEVGFTGGFNLADEYINEINKYGHWKDTGIMFKGACVNNLTIMFLQFWAMKNNFIEDYSRYFNKFDKHKKISENNDFHFVQAFNDSPLDRDNIFENLYIKILYNAKKYVYINTPYLIIDNDLKLALSTAAKSGIDVRITIPKIPDKKIIFMVTKSFAKELIEEGVKIYEYSPGFLHAKSFVSDDKYSIIGTANLDYRSLYLHFECGAFIFGEKIALDMKKDYLKTLEISEELTLDKVEKNKILEVCNNILKLFAPMM